MIPVIKVQSPDQLDAILDLIKSNPNSADALLNGDKVHIRLALPEMEDERLLVVQAPVSNSTNCLDLADPNSEEVAFSFITSNHKMLKYTRGNHETIQISESADSRLNTVDEIIQAEIATLRMAGFDMSEGYDTDDVESINYAFQNIKQAVWPSRLQH